MGREDIMKIYVCKTCGRSMRTRERPVCCYQCRMDAIEEVSDVDAAKMGLDIPEGEAYEFPGDVKYNPMSGKPMTLEGATLAQFQDAIMVKVRGSA